MSEKKKKKEKSVAFATEEGNEPVRKRTPRMSMTEKKRIIRLRTVNKLPVTEIGQIIDRPANTVSRYLQRISPTNQILNEFKGKEADTLSYTKSISRGVRVALLTSLQEDAEKSGFSDMTPKEKASVNQSLAIAEGIDTEKERLIRGLATHISGYEDAEAQLQQIDARLRSLGIDPQRVIEVGNNAPDVVCVQNSTPVETPKEGDTL